MKPGPDELHIEDDEGRTDFHNHLSDVVMAAQGYGGKGLPETLGEVWRFVFGEPYPWPDEYDEMEGGIKAFSHTAPDPDAAVASLRCVEVLRDPGGAAAEWEARIRREERERFAVELRNVVEQRGHTDECGDNQGSCNCWQRTVDECITAAFRSLPIEASGPAEGEVTR